MKRLIYITAIIAMVLGVAACANSQNKQNNTLLVEGTIQKLEMSTFQYGTHTLEGKDGFFALRSEKVELNDYNGQEVKVEAQKVEGYPVDGGPVFLEVIAIKK